MVERQEKYIENFSKLIKFDTVSVEGDVNPEKFREFHKVLKETFPNIFKACEFRDFTGSILMRWPGADSNKEIYNIDSLGDYYSKQKKLPVMFMNHMDVVAPEGEWKHEPFSAELADGAIWGRGTLDTKGGLWGMLQAAEELALAGFVPDRDIYFESACTEETFGEGAIEISEWMISKGLQFEMIFDEGGMVMYDPIGGADGTFAMVGLGEKCCTNIRFIARSNGGHASTPGKNSPLVRLGKFMAEMESTAVFDVHMSGTIKEMFRRISPYMGGLGFVMGKPDLFNAALKKAVPMVSSTAGAMLKTTLAFTMAKGSEASNAMPTEAWVVGNMRSSHHQGEAASLAAIKKVADKYEIEMDVYDPGVESRLTDYRGSAFALVEKACKATLKNVDEVVPYVMTGASDSRYYDKVCDQCIRFLPFTINEQQLESIHGINENLNIDTLVPAVDYFKYLMENV